VPKHDFTKIYINEFVIALLGTIDFLDHQGRVDFRTIPEEKPYLVFQIGAADPDLAVEAALKVFVSFHTTFHFVFNRHRHYFILTVVTFLIVHKT
jgi:hypothetical protein